MKVKVSLAELPQREYPYLAVYTGGEENQYKFQDLIRIPIKDIVVISKIYDSNNQNKEATYVQHLIGGKQAFITKHEHEYQPFPLGFQIFLTQ